MNHKGKIMKIKMLKDWRGWFKGRTYTLGGGIADALIRCGAAIEERIQEENEPNVIQTCSLQPRETACLNTERRKQGRPKKVGT